jgi:hypothetical protein
MTKRNTKQAGERQRRHAKSGESQSVLSRLTGEESSLVLHMLLKRHELLREEAENLATEIVNTPCCADIAAAVADAVTSQDIQDLSGRAGATRWGYTEPTEAAWQLLEESLEDFLADMKRRAELGLTDAAVTMCHGIIVGLYKAKGTPSDGPLGWAPDFPAEEAGHVVTELLRASFAQTQEAVRLRLLDAITADVPVWAEMLTRAASEGR